MKFSKTNSVEEERRAEFIEALTVIMFFAPAECPN
jgi:hypothetical protein